MGGSTNSESPGVLNWASLVTGRDHVQKPPHNLAHPPQEREAGGLACFETTLALSLTDTVSGSQGLQLREVGAGSQAAAPSRAPSANGWNGG